MINIFRLASLEEGSYDKSPLLGSLLMQIWLQFEPNIPIHSVKEILLFTIEQIKQIDLKLINIPVEFFKFSRYLYYNLVWFVFCILDLFTTLF